MSPTQTGGATAALAAAVAAAGGAAVAPAPGASSASALAEQLPRLLRLQLPLQQRRRQRRLQGQLRVLPRSAVQLRLRRSALPARMHRPGRHAGGRLVLVQQQQKRAAAASACLWRVQQAAGAGLAPVCPPAVSGLSAMHSSSSPAAAHRHRQTRGGAGWAERRRVLRARVTTAVKRRWVSAAGRHAPEPESVLPAAVGCAAAVEPAAATPACQNRLCRQRLRCCALLRPLLLLLPAARVAPHRSPVPALPLTPAPAHLQSRRC